MTDRHLPQKSTRKEIDAFLAKASTSRLPTTTSGRLLFAMDATASREPTWDHACHLQAQMFEVSETLGGLAVQLCYYRSLNEFHSSAWHYNPAALLHEMNAVRCLAGHTQIERVLRHALATAKLNAVVFIGDAMEEDATRLRQLGGELGLRGVPVFMFHEGHDALTRSVFSDIARLSHGACCPFDINSPEQLRQLIGAVAVYASGGHRALTEYCKKQADQKFSRQLLQQLQGPTRQQHKDDKT